MVRLFADECVAGSIIERLRSKGFGIARGSEVCPTVDDEHVLAKACRDGRILITADKDFGELVVRLRHRAHGVVNLALGDLAALTRARIASARLSELGDRIVGNIVTIEAGRVRIRPLPRCRSKAHVPCHLGMSALSCGEAESAMRGLAWGGNSAL